MSLPVRYAILPVAPGELLMVAAGHSIILPDSTGRRVHLRLPTALEYMDAVIAEDARLAALDSTHIPVPPITLAHAINICQPITFVGRRTYP